MDVSYAVIFAVPADIILNWEEYRRMLHNIGWKTPPDSYKIIKTDRHYYAVLNAICHETNDTPSRIRTRRQFIQALKMQKVYSRGNRSFVNKYCPQELHDEYEAFDEKDLLIQSK